MATTVTQESALDLAFSSSTPFNAADAQVALATLFTLPPTSAAVLPDNQFYVKKIVFNISDSKPGNIKIPPRPAWFVATNPSGTSSATTANPSLLNNTSANRTIHEAFRNTTRLSMIPTIYIREETTLSGSTILTEITMDRPTYPTDNVRNDSFSITDSQDNTSVPMLKYYQRESNTSHHIFTSYNSTTEIHYILLDIFHNKLADNAGVQIALVNDIFTNPDSIPNTLAVKDYEWYVLNQTVTKVSILIKIGSYDKSTFNNIDLSILIMGNQIRI